MVLSLSTQNTLRNGGSTMEAKRRLGIFATVVIVLIIILFGIRSIQLSRPKETPQTPEELVPNYIYTKKDL